jgi:hypothetical protein
MREILGEGTDFGESMVGEWLGDYLREGLAALEDTEG